MIGHMILRKYYDGEDVLGLKVIGGQPLPYDTPTSGGGGPRNNGTTAAIGGVSNISYGAIVDKVKRGSVADTEGHIKAGNT